MIQKGETFDIKLPGPASDGIDHNHDVFVLLLNPLLTVAQFPGSNVQVAMGVDGPTMNIQYVYAGWLNGVTAMAPGVKQQLDAAGLDAEDYQQILSTNPFQSGSTVIDTNRFIALPESFAYEPPYGATEAPWVATYTVQNTTTATNTVIVEYSVSASIGVSIEKIFNIGSSVTWTNTNTTITTDTTMESASVTVGGPSFGYTGATDILVYWDSVYHSYMFAIPAGEVAPGSPVRSRKKRVAAVAKKSKKKTRNDAAADWSLGRAARALCLWLRKTPRRLPSTDFLVNGKPVLVVWDGQERAWFECGKGGLKNWTRNPQRMVRCSQARPTPMKKGQVAKPRKRRAATGSRYHGNPWITDGSSGSVEPRGTPRVLWPMYLDLLNKLDQHVASVSGT